MKTTSIAVLTALAGLWGCSTPQPAEPRQPHVTVATIHPYLEPPSKEDLPEVFKGEPCQLGKSCLALDPRPFEICLLGTQKRCGDKMAEAMQVDDAGKPGR